MENSMEHDLENSMWGEAKNLGSIKKSMRELENYGKYESQEDMRWYQELCMKDLVNRCTNLGTYVQPQVLCEILDFVNKLMWYIWLRELWVSIARLLMQDSTSHIGNEVISMWDMNSDLRIMETYEMMEIMRSWEYVWGTMNTTTYR